MRVFLQHLARLVLLNRSGIMGVAIIWIFLLHSAIGQNYFGVDNYILDHGWVGVDIFIFLSSFGLCFSFSKNSLKQFYYRRLVRVIPTWLIILFLIHIIGLIVSPLYPNMQFVYPRNFIDIICWYTGIGYWINGCFYEWYVPTLLLLYLIFPFIYKLSNRSLWGILILITVLTLSFYYWEFLFNIRLSYTRLIAYILGVLFYRYLNANQLQTFYIPIFALSLIMFVIHKRFGISDVFLYEYLTPILVLIIAWLINILKLTNVLSFWGAISLEFYLIHLYRRPQFFVGIFTDSVLLQHVIAFFLCTVAAYILNRIMKNVNQYFLNFVK